MTIQGQATVSTVLLMLLTVALGGPLLWGFAFSALGMLTWLIAAFGWLPGDFFATNFSFLSQIAGAIALPVLAYVCYRLVPQVHRVELALAAGAEPMSVPLPAVPPPAMPTTVTATATAPTAPPAPARTKKKKRR
jgi:hypothetical protein